MGKLIVTGNGKKIMPNVIMQGVVCVLCFAVAVYCISAGNTNPYYDPQYPALSSLMRPSSGQQTMAMFGYLLFVLAIVSLLKTFNLFLAAKSEIKVFDNRLEGLAFSGNPFVLQSFTLDYGQISNIDVIKKTAVTVYSAGAKYKCYASNAEEVQRIVKEKQTIKQ